MKSFFKIFHTSASALLCLVGAASCAMMTESREDCPEGLYVRFVYDFNTQRADMFKDHVGHVRLSVFDTEGRKVAEKEVSNSGDNSPLGEYGYTIHFTPEELPAGSYRLQAVGMQRDWTEAEATPGAKYRRNSVDTHDQLHISLDHSAEKITGTEQFAVSDEAPLDTLWHTLKVMSLEPRDGVDVPAVSRTSRPYSIYPLEEQYVTVIPEHATYATVSMIRDTKHLNVTLREIDEPASVSADKYEVKIMDNNGHLAHDNTVETHDSLRYTPYAAWTTRFLDNGTLEIESVDKGNLGQAKAPRAGEDANVTQRTAHYNLMFNRLMHNADDSDDNAILQITNKETGKVVAHINLPSVLAEGRVAYDIYNYGEQEYLDREHDYHLNFFLKGDKWLYCDIVINVLAWTKRKQNVDL